MNLEQKTTEFWWGAKQWRLKRSEADYEMMLLNLSTVDISPRLANRLAELKHQHDKKPDKIAS
jgi:hypothetical protein